MRAAQIKTIVGILIGVIVLITIYMLLNKFSEISSRVDNAQIQNLRSSLETSLRQQAARSYGSSSNITLAVPDYIEKICFYDPSKAFTTRSPDTDLLEKDTQNNFAIFFTEGFERFSIPKISADINPLCTKNNQNRISLSLTTDRDSVKIRSAHAEKEVCVSVLEHGPSESKIDIVFLNYRYEHIQEYTDDVDRYVNNVILEFEPFKFHKEKFNFFRLDATNVSCTIANFISCSQFEIKRAASKCPHDHIILLVDRKAFSDLVRPVRSSAIGNIIKINTADKPFVVVHEFGHTFADLADEYVDEKYYSEKNFHPEEYINCDVAPCPSWRDIESTECFQGCSLNQYFRPTRDSIMRSLSSPTFGPVNEKEIETRLAFYD